MATDMVLDGGADVFGDHFDSCEDFAEAFAVPFGAIEGGVCFGDVGGVVLGVVNFHGFGVDMGFERVVGEAEFRECEWHFDLLLMGAGGVLVLFGNDSRVLSEIIRTSGWAIVDMSRICNWFE